MGGFDPVFSVVAGQLFEELLRPVPVLEVIEHVLDGGDQAFRLHIHGGREQVPQCRILGEQVTIKRTDQPLGSVR